MKSSLMKMISHEIAVICSETTVENANSQLVQMLHTMVEGNEEEEAPPDEKESV